MVKHSIINHLNSLDNILSIIASNEHFAISKKELDKTKIDSSKLDFLIQEGYLIKTHIPTHFRLSYKAILHIAKGGFKSEYKKLKTDRLVNLSYLISSSFILLISLVISFHSYISKTNTLKPLKEKVNALDKKTDSIKSRQKQLFILIDSSLSVRQSKPPKHNKEKQTQ